VLKLIENLSELKRFSEWVDTRHDYAQRWKKETGGKVVGYICTYVPEEILYAANILPVRILGSKVPDSSSRVYHHDMWCPFSHDCLSTALRGDFDYLDGIVTTLSCLHMRQVFWLMRDKCEFDWSYFIPFPHGTTNNPYAEEYAASELENFKVAVEEWTGSKITKSDLEASIEIYNKNRKLMKKIYELRKGDNPPITGLHSMEMVLASQLVDKKAHNEVLESLLEKLENVESDREQGSRLMLIGSENDDRDFMRLVEYEINYPATFVFEEHCTGARYFWSQISQNNNLVEALAKYYVDRIPCPSKDWGAAEGKDERRRFSFIKEIAKEYRVDGTILMQQKFCNPHELDIPGLRDLFKELNIPTYTLEFDQTTPVGQFSTRVEAFLESIGEEILF